MYSIWVAEQTAHIRNKGVKVGHVPGKDGAFDNQGHHVKCLFRHVFSAPVVLNLVNQAQPFQSKYFILFKSKVGTLYVRI